MLQNGGVRTGLATNQQAIRARFMAEELGYEARFDELFFSFSIGHAKPSPDYFSAVLRALELDGGQVLFIDDHMANVTAARESGLNAEVFSLKAGPSRMLELLGNFGLGHGPDYKPDTCDG